MWTKINDKFFSDYTTKLPSGDKEFACACQLSNYRLSYAATTYFDNFKSIFNISISVIDIFVGIRDLVQSLLGNYEATWIQVYV